MTEYNFEMVDEPDVAIDRLDDEKVLLINEVVLQGDVFENIIPMLAVSGRSEEDPFVINIQLESVNARKIKILLDILCFVLSYYRIEDVMVIWYYEATDEKAYEAGMKIQAMIKIKFTFQVY